MKVLFLVCAFNLVYVYGWYMVILRLMLWVRGRKDRGRGSEKNEAVSIIVAALNEEEKIGKRIENLIGLEYPRERIKIIVGSDGSTDKTADIAKSYARVMVLELREMKGRGAVQNEGVKAAKGQVVIFTDAETEFEKDCLVKMMRYFDDRSIGCVVGNLIYRTDGGGISASERAYWRYEKKIREMESDLGILGTGTGACMAIRKELWRDLTPIDDVDFTSPLDVILQGYRVVYAPDVLAYDAPPSTVKEEVRTRIRQTSRNFLGTLKRWGWRGFLKHPIVSWGLLSHKVLRWLTPFFMCGAFVSNLFLLEEGLFFEVTFALQVGFYVVAVVGGLGEIVKKNIPIASTLFSFCVANIGMGLGVIKGLLGKAPASYRE